jgi:HAD superfamily hydrolase (TIGR01509 family)
MTLKAFIFDMDGVLVDTQRYHTQAYLEALHEAGYEASSEEIASYAGTKLGTTSRGLSKAHGYHWTDEQMSHLEQRKCALFDKIISQVQLEPIAGIPELLQSLQQRHIPMAIASSSSDEFIAFIVDKLHIRTYFDHLLSGQNLPESKPNPAIYRLAAQAVGEAPEDCAILEDAGLGVQAAKAAGAMCIGYRNLNSGHQDLSKADIVVDDIADIDLEAL